MSHPEMQTNERYIGNLNLDNIKHPPPHYSSFKTLRPGVQAYDINGEKLPANYKPLFIDVSEIDFYYEKLTGAVRATLQTKSATWSTLFSSPPVLEFIGGD